MRPCCVMRTPSKVASERVAEPLFAFSQGVLRSLAFADVADHADQGAPAVHGCAPGTDLHGEGAAVFASVDGFEENALRLCLNHLIEGEFRGVFRSQIMNRACKEFLAAVPVGCHGGGIGVEDAPVVHPHEQDDVPAVVGQQSEADLIRPGPLCRCAIAPIQRADRINCRLARSMRNGGCGRRSSAWSLNSLLMMYVPAIYVPLKMPLGCHQNPNPWYVLLSNWYDVFKEFPRFPLTSAFATFTCRNTEYERENRWRARFIGVSQGGHSQGGIHCGCARTGCG